MRLEGVHHTRGSPVVEVTDWSTCRALLNEPITSYNDNPHAILTKEPKCEPKAVLVYPEESKEEVEKGFSESDYFRSQVWKGN